MSEEIKDIGSSDAGGDLYDAGEIAEVFMAGEEVAMAQDGGGIGGDDAPAPEKNEVAEPHIDYPVPEGWAQDMWDGMAPEARGAVDKLVKANADAASKHAAEMQAMQKQVQATLAKANADAQNVLNLVRAVTEGDFGDMDWEALKASPETYFQVEKAYRERQAAIQQIQQQLAQQAQIVAQNQAKALDESVRAELAMVMPKIKALIGSGYANETYRAELKEYLEKSGVPAQAIGSITKGYELELATKAMLFDKLQSAREAAAAKVASAPAVQPPRGAVTVDGGDKLKQARARLDRNPDDLDAIAGLFEAM